jgi:hypothetical protein
MTQTTNTSSTQIAVGKKKTAPGFPVRLSFLQVFEAKLPKQPKPGDLPKFSVQVIVDKKSPDVKLINAAMRAAAAESKATKALDYDTLDLILRDGDNPKENKKKAAHLLGKFFFNASCGEDYPPQVVGSTIDPETGKLERLTKRDIKSGDFGAVTVNFYGYDSKGNQGVSAGLRNIQKLATGESLAGAADADEDFEADEDDDFMK